jgi:hypothetical protein
MTAQIANVIREVLNPGCRRLCQGDASLHVYSWYPQEGHRSKVECWVAFAITPLRVRNFSA